MLFFLNSPDQYNLLSSQTHLISQLQDKFLDKTGLNICLHYKKYIYTGPQHENTRGKGARKKMHI